MRTLTSLIALLCPLVLHQTEALAQTVYHVDMKLEGMIDPGVSAFVERVIEDAEANEVDAIVFEIDTFGGRVDAATVIDGRVPHAILIELFTKGGVGTQIVRN